MKTLLAECTSELHAPQRTEKCRMDEVLATLGHELRNPLSALSYALEIWPGCETDPAQMGELRNIMQRQVSQLTRLSDELRDAARVTQGTLQLRREPVSLRHLIDGACEQIQPFIDRCGHTMTVQLPSESTVVDGDPSRLLQVFANLIQNAAKFTHRNGSLSVTAESQDGMAVVRVRDNGEGIEEQTLPDIFDAYAQMHGTRKPGNDGLGIGLRLVKSIVDLHGGSVAVHSAGLGQGSEFTVRLPLLNDVPHKPLSGTESPVDSHNGQPPPAYRIVVVDDDRANRVLLARLLHTLGQSVTVANNGATAIQMVLDERPQVVFLDLMMHGMDGCEVASELRSYPELAGLVLIALSGSGEEESRGMANAAGFNKYLVKPTSIAMLVETLSGIPALCPAQS